MVILLVVFLALAVLLFVGTLFAQGAIYSEPEAGLTVKAPAAAAILTAFLAFWCYLNYSSVSADTLQAPYGTLLQFSPKDTKTFDKIWSVRGSREILFTRTGAGGLEFQDSQGRPWRRSDADGIVEAILIEENGNKARFEPQLVDGKFPADAGAFPGYREKGGSRYMEVIGQLTTFRWGQFLLNLFLNFGHLGLWFVCLWLVLRFQWTHALFGAAVIWLVMTLVVVPMLLERSLIAGKERAAQTAPPAAVPATAPASGT